MLGINLGAIRESCAGCFRHVLISLSRGRRFRDDSMSSPTFTGLILYTKYMEQYKGA